MGSSGERLHLTCTGSGDSTVVLVAGFGGGGEGWGAVSTSVAERARVCSYSRFGTGTSDAPPSTQTFSTQADDLRALLRAAGEPGPYVVVGHSFGGVEAAVFASRFRDEVEGLVLLDASPVRWPAVVCAVTDDGSPTASSFGDVCRSISDPAHNPERLDAGRAFAEAAAVRTLGDLPLAVLTRADVSYPGLEDGEARRLSDEWQRGQEHWASLSSHGNLVAVRDTGHHIEVDQPALVIRHIVALLR